MNPSPTQGSSSNRAGRALKLLDRFAGIPLVTILGLRRRRMLPDRIRRIGLMKTAAIGDALLLAGFVSDLRVRYSGAVITLILGPDNVAVAPLIGDADSVVTVSPRLFSKSVRTVRALDLDVLVDFGSWPRFDAALSALSGARFTIGFATKGQHRHAAYDRTVEHRADLHERENYERLVAEIGLAAPSPARIVTSSTLDSSAIPFNPFAVFHPWATGLNRQNREWSTERWIELARALKQRGMSILITGGPADGQSSSELATALRSGGIAAHSVAGRFTIPQTAELLRAADVVVSVNTGIAHLAGLVGAPTITLHGPTSVRRWRPLGPRTRAIASVYPNCGYLNLGFEYDGQRTDCMDGVTVDAVLSALDELIA